MQELSDNELITKYLNGEAAALDEIIRRYFRQIFLFAKTYVKDDMEAEDVTQETFVKVWRYIKKYDRNKKFKTWLFQIAKNTCLDFLRKHKNKDISYSLSEEQMLNELEKITDSEPLPQEVFDAKNFTNYLQKILNSLTGKYKTVTSLHLQQEMTFDEIANILEEPLNTVKSRYRRALLLIKKRLSENIL